MLNSLLWKMGGAEQIFLGVLRGLAKHHEISIICSKLNPQQRGELQDLNVEVFETGFSHIGSGDRINAAKDWLLLPRSSRKVAKILREVRADVLNPHNFPDIFHSAYYKTQAKKVKILWYCHEPYRPFYDPAVVMSKPISERFFWGGYRSLVSYLEKRYVSSWVDAIGTNSNYTASLIKAVYGRDSHIIHPGIDPEVFRPVRSDLRERLGCDVLIVSVGNIDFSYKNSSIIPLVMRELKSRIRTSRRLKWLHVGSGKDESKLLQATRNNKVSESFETVNQVSVKELVQFYSAANVTVYPPVEEPFGLVPLEAMACGSPVVASKYGGPAETIVHGRTGFLVDTRMASEICHAVMRLIQDEKTSREMGAFGRRRVVEFFTLNRTIHKFSVLLEEVNQERSIRLNH